MSHKIITKNDFDDSLTQYGDGVFETMLAIGDSIHHWHYHWQRLEKSCQRLEISVPESELLYQQLCAELIKHGNEFSVVKMIVSRGEGLRGYRTHPEQSCFVQFSISKHSPTPTLYQGLNVRVCETRLSYQPLLAGIKHLNCLEYVMARREVNHAEFDEGLLLDYDNKLIEGTISNIFMIKKQCISTPTLSGSGVSGTMRAYLIDALPTWGYSITERDFTMDDLADADAVFLTNATAGVIPVSRIQGIDKQFDIGMANHIRHKVVHPCCEN